MGELWDGITGFFGNISEYVRNYQISAIVNRMQVVKCRDALDNVYNLAPPWLKGDQGVKDFYDMRYEEFTDSGTITLVDVAKGPGVDYVKAFIKEFEGLYNNINETLGGVVAKSYTATFTKFTGRELGADAKKKLSGTDIPAAVDGIIDSILDMAMDPFLEAAPEMERPMEAKVRKGVRETLKMSAGLGATLGLGAYIMEHWHPTKSTNASRFLNTIMDTVGYKSMRDASLKPLRYAAIELPLRYKWNQLFQSGLPTQGEITGLARKYEISKDQYRDAMAKQNVAPFWIEALLTGFWADPRLFEIIRLMEVERPPKKVPDEARTWLTKAGLEQYIGDDWWLAMKFAKAGYDNIDIPVLVSAVKARNVQKELGDIRTLNRNKYKQGGYSRKEYEVILKSRGISAPEVKELIDAIDDELALKERSEFQRAYERKYLYGHISKEDLKTRLKELKLREGYISSRMEYLFTMKEGKLSAEGDEKTLTLARILNTYKYGQKEVGWAYTEVGNLGYDEEDTALLVESVDQKVKNDTDREWRRAYEAQYLYGRMTLQDVQTKLEEHGFDAGRAEARVAYLEQQQMGTEKEEAVEEVEEVEE